jgi:divalent metal cation (Fe/Co/Zn/Cd) transporter
VEVDASADLLESHELIDDIERDILRDMGVRLVIHLDPVVTDDPMIVTLRDAVARILEDIDPVLRFHDFRMTRGKNHRNLFFDVVAPFRFRLTEVEICDRIQQALTALDPRLFAIITLDRAAGEETP